jgi:excisionase family DNA binding protein
MLITTTEAARIANVHPATIREWVRRGKINALRTPGGHRRFNSDDLNETLYGKDYAEFVKVSKIDEE